MRPFYVGACLLALLSVLGIIAAVVAYRYRAAARRSAGTWTLVRVRDVVAKLFEPTLIKVRTGAVTHGLKGPQPAGRAQVLLAYLLLTLESELRRILQVGNGRRPRLAELSDKDLRGALGCCGPVSLGTMYAREGLPGEGIRLESLEHGWLTVPLEALCNPELMALVELSRLRQAKKGENATAWTALERGCSNVLAVRRGGT